MVAAQERVSQIRLVAVERILPNPLNPRGEITPDSVVSLVDSIKSVGILQPLIVTPSKGIYHIVAGHRRHVAAKLAGMNEVPVIAEPFTERQQLEIMLVENIQREDLTPTQEARSYQKLIELGSPQREIAERTGQRPDRVSRYLSILNLHPNIQEAIDKMRLPLGAIKYLVQIKDEKTQLHIAHTAIAQGMSIDEIGKLAEKPPSRATQQRRNPPESVVLSIPKPVYEYLVEWAIEKGVTIHALLLDQLIYAVETDIDIGWDDGSLTNEEALEWGRKLKDHLHESSSWAKQSVEVAETSSD